MLSSRTLWPSHSNYQDSEASRNVKLFSHKSVPLTSYLLPHRPGAWSQTGLFTVWAGWLEYKCHQIVAFKRVTLQPVFGKILWEALRKETRRVSLSCLIHSDVTLKKRFMERGLKKTKKKWTKMTLLLKRKAILCGSEANRAPDYKGHSVIKVQTIYKSPKNYSFHCQRYSCRLDFTRTRLSSPFKSQFWPKC